MLARRSRTRWAASLGPAAAALLVSLVVPLAAPVPRAPPPPGLGGLLDDDRHQLRRQRHGRLHCQRRRRRVLHLHHRPRRRPLAEHGGDVWEPRALLRLLPARPHLDLRRPLRGCDLVSRSLRGIGHLDAAGLRLLQERTRARSASRSSASTSVSGARPSPTVTPSTPRSRRRHRSPASPSPRRRATSSTPAAPEPRGASARSRARVVTDRIGAVPVERRRRVFTRDLGHADARRVLGVGPDEGFVRALSPTDERAEALHRGDGGRRQGERIRVPTRATWPASTSRASRATPTRPR